MKAPTLADEIAVLRAHVKQGEEAAGFFGGLGEKGDAELAALRSALVRLGAMRWRHDAAAVRLDALEAAAQIADSFTCGACGMDGKAGAAIRALAAVPLPSPTDPQEGER